MVLAGQVFLRLISSKQLSAYTHTHTNGEDKQDNVIPVAKRNLEVDSATIAGRKSVNREQEYGYNPADLKMIHTFWGMRSFVQTTCVTARL